MDYRNHEDLSSFSGEASRFPIAENQPPSPEEIRPNWMQTLESIDNDNIAIIAEYNHLRNEQRRKQNALAGHILNRENRESFLRTTRNGSTTDEVKRSQRSLKHSNTKIIILNAELTEIEVAISRSPSFRDRRIANAIRTLNVLGCAGDIDSLTLTVTQMNL
jgi:hypothetical protein